MSLVPYNKGTPTEVGVYACRIPLDGGSWYEDKFLFWDGKRWGYPCSDQNYRGEVAGWVGPLQRRI